MRFHKYVSRSVVLAVALGGLYGLLSWPGLPAVLVFVNGHPISRLDLRWTPGRTGAYDLHLPRSVVTQGFNRLKLRAEAPSPQAIGYGDGFKLWYVRVRPNGMREP